MTHTQDWPRDWTRAEIAEYDAAAEWCAVRGLTGAIGTPLPPLLSATVAALIDDDIEAFEERVKLTKYARAMNAREGGAE